MYPVIFAIGPLTIYSYGLLLAIGFLTAIWLAMRNVRGKAGFDEDKIVDLALVMLVAGIIGARLTYVLLNINEYINSPLEIIKIHHGGLVFYGGLIAALVSAWIWVRHWKLSFLKIADIMLPYVALGQAIGRIGCLLNGCCYGRTTDLDISICLPGHVNSLHPAQVYSSLFLLVIFVTLRIIADRSEKPGLVTVSYFIFYAAGRFVVEFFRGDVPEVFLGLTFSQLVSVVVFFTAVVGFKIFCVKSVARN